MSLDAGKGSTGNGYSGTMVYDLLTAIEQPPMAEAAAVREMAALGAFGDIASFQGVLRYRA
jgi:hypothetical protein